MAPGSLDMVYGHLDMFDKWAPNNVVRPRAANLYFRPVADNSHFQLVAGR